jgi:hypothetical protein
MAVYLFRKGCKVLPLKQGQKVPHVHNLKDWYADITEEKILAHGRKYPKDNWAVSAGLSDLCIIDLDVKHDPKGLQVFFDFLQENQYPLTFDTWTVRTPSGGYHYYYRGKIDSSAQLIPGVVDIRSGGREFGGLALLPGCSFNGGSYTLEVDKDIAPTPQWIGDHVQSKKSSGLESYTTDKEFFKSFESGNRNNSFTQRAGQLRGQGYPVNIIAETLHAVNAKIDEPLDEKEVETIAASVGRYSPNEAKAATQAQKDFEKIIAKKDIGPKPFSIDMIKQIKKRNWFMLSRYVGGFVSMVTADGGRGKSLLTMLDSVAMASGKPISGFEVKQCNVWYHNAEDPRDEVAGRIASICKNHNVDIEKSKNLFVSGEELKLIVASEDHTGLQANDGALSYIRSFISKNDIEVLIVDPLINMHTVNENSSTSMNKVTSAFTNIAKELGISVCIVHHNHKNAGGLGSANSGRGSSAIVNACRIVHTLSGLDKSDIDDFQLDEEEARQYVRLDQAKANLSAPGLKTTYYKKLSVELEIADDEIETYGVLEKANLVSIVTEQNGIAGIQNLTKTIEKLPPTENETIDEWAKRINKKPQLKKMFMQGKTTPTAKSIAESIKNVFDQNKELKDISGFRIKSARGRNRFILEKNKDDEYMSEEEMESMLYH